MLRRDRLWNEAAKPNFAFTPRDEFVAAAPALLEEIQRALFDQAAERREANIVRSIDSIEALKAFFGEDRKYPGWIEVQWSKPEGAALDKVVEQLKALKLTFRNVPVNAAPAEPWHRLGARASRFGAAGTSGHTAGPSGWVRGWSQGGLTMRVAGSDRFDLPNLLASATFITIIFVC